MSNNYRPGGFGGFSFFPPVIKNLLIINAAIFFIQNLIGGSVVIGNNSLEYVIIKYFALIPFEFDRFAFLPHQLITYQFLHADFGHILFNMFSLWMFGMELENVWGSRKFLFFYLLCGVVAGVAHLLINPLLSSSGPVLGASGAIFGVMVAFAMMFPDRYIFIYFLIPVKAKYLIGFLIVLEFLFINGSGSNVARLAHLGGALAGFVYVLIDRKRGINFNIFNKKTFDSFNKKRSNFNPFSKSDSSFRQNKYGAEDAKYYEINKNAENDEPSQEEIDAILDKISQSGYQNLTEKEKHILFRASKKIK